MKWGGIISSFRFGIPYKGSKNAIAGEIIEQLPPAEVFVDLFCGGGAITHAAMLSGKYKRFIMNDIEESPVKLFRQAVNGEFKNEKRWISREDFFKLKDKEPYVKYCWSFSYNGRDYLYCKEIEPWKKALHYARVLHDYSEFEKMGIHTDGSKEDILQHIGEYFEKYRKFVELESLERLQRLERLQSLESKVGDYQSVDIPTDSVIYCDIPYKGTDVYEKQSFDYERFYRWARQQNNIFISEYSMPEDFICVWAKNKTVLVNQNGADGYALEKLYTTKENENKPITFFEF